MTLTMGMLLAKCVHSKKRLPIPRSFHFIQFLLLTDDFTGTMTNICPSCTSQLGMLHVYGVYIATFITYRLFIIDLQY